MREHNTKNRVQDISVALQMHHNLKLNREITDSLAKCSANSVIISTTRIFENLFPTLTSLGFALVSNTAIVLLGFVSLVFL